MIEEVWGGVETGEGRFTVPSCEIHIGSEPLRGSRAEERAGSARAALVGALLDGHQKAQHHYVFLGEVELTFCLFTKT